MGAYSKQYSYEYLAGHVARYGVLYPMQTFSKQREVDFGQIPCFVESNSEEDVQLLKDIASALSEKVYEASSEQRKSLHLAAVFTCNFTNHMYVLAAELLKKYGLPFEAMLPLIDETARKVHELEPLAAQAEWLCAMMRMSLTSICGCLPMSRKCWNYIGRLARIYIGWQ